MDEVKIFKGEGGSDLELYNETTISNKKALFFVSVAFCFIYFCKFLFSKDSKPEVKVEVKFPDILPRIIMNNKFVIPTLSELFNSREIYISESNLTLDYIHYIRPINDSEEEEFKKPLYPNIEPNLKFTENRANQIDINTYYHICINEKLISEEKIIYDNKPDISIIIPNHNNKDMLLKSIRSIQNQSFKNIEIIIVDDYSTDNSTEIYKYLLKTDPRIRIFKHLKNFGAWRSRLDGFLYSRAKFILHFDTGDFYTDNLVLEDVYKLITNYNLDSLRFSFKLSKKIEDINFESWNFTFSRQDRKIVYGTRTYNGLFWAYGPIWNRITRANIFTKGLDFLDEYILNAYKNIYEDRWWNSFANNASYSYCMVNRVGYLYLRIPGGSGVIYYGSKEQNERSLRELIYLWYFDYIMLDKKDDKSSIMNEIIKYNGEHKNLNLKTIKHYFPTYIHLLDLLINDTYISESDRQLAKILRKRAPTN
jgi:glycosyltransferase involved in cell wall biosynthesis